MEINQILTVNKARKIIKSEIEKRNEIIYKELTKLRSRLIDLESLIKFKEEKWKNK